MLKYYNNKRKFKFINVIFFNFTQSGVISFMANAKTMSYNVLWNYTDLYCLHAMPFAIARKNEPNDGS